MIGIIVCPRALKYLAKHPHGGKSKLEAYRPLAKKYKVDLCFYTIHRIIKNNQVKGYIYSYRHQTLNEKVIRLPKVSLYCNTAYIRKRKHVNQIQHLQRTQEVHLINVPSNHQRHKLRNHHYLESIEGIRPHLPDTTVLTLQNLIQFLEKYNRVGIKPVIGSKGRRITIIEKDDNDFLIRTTSYQKPQTKKSEQVVSKRQLQRFFTKHFKHPSAYLVQQWIPLLTYNGQPFDLRLAVQKNKNRKWQVTSCVARATGKNGVVSNLEQGGKMVSFHKLKLKKYKQKVYDLSLKIAKALEQKYPHTADIGIDLALDQFHHLWFIEANFCSHKKKWSTIYRIPFEYAYAQYRYLA